MLDRDRVRSGIGSNIDQESCSTKAKHQGGGRKNQKTKVVCQHLSAEAVGIAQAYYGNSGKHEVGVGFISAEAGQDEART